MRLRILVVVLVIMAALTPWGRSRIRALNFKLSGNAPEWSWANMAVGMIPFTDQSNLLNAPFRDPVNFVKRDSESPCPVLWDTPLGPMWAWFLDAGHLRWHTQRWPRLVDLFPDSPSIPEGGIVLEVGAWVGTFTREALNRGAGKVVAIEPEPSNYVCLEKNFAQEIVEKRVILVKAAAWDSDGTARFDHPSFNEWGSLQLGGEGFTALRDGDVVVQTRTIDGIVHELGLESVGLIEMDIEGTERYALAGAKETLARFNPDIIVCVHHLPDDPVIVDETILSANPAYGSSIQDGHAYYRVGDLTEDGKR